MATPSKERVALHDQGLRRCARCKECLPLSSFNKKADDYFGLQSLCRECNKANTRKYYNENKEHHRAVCDAWQASNPERTKAARQRWRTENVDREIENRRSWKQSNPEKVKIYVHKRRILLKAATFEVTAKDVARLLSKPCYHCGAPSEHIDHVIPVKLGGSHSVGNLAGLCAFCNMSKGPKLYAEFRYKS